MKVSIELPVATRHRRDMTEKLLKVTLNPNKQQFSLNYSQIPSLSVLLIDMFFQHPPTFD